MTSFAAFFLSLFHIALLYSVSAITRIPLQREKEDNDTPFARRLSLHMSPCSKHNSLPTFLAENVRNLDLVREAGVRIRNYANAQYFGTVEIGGQGPFNVLFDTGSSDLWVPSRQCGFFQCGLLHPKYDSGKSKTYEKDGTHFNLKYVSGAVSGIYSGDDVRIGPLVAKGQRFAEVSTISNLGERYVFAIYDGVSTIMRGRTNQPSSSCLLWCLILSDAISSITALCPGFYFSRIPVFLIELFAL